MLSKNIIFKDKRLLEEEEFDNNDAVIQLISYDIHENKIPFIFARESTSEGLDKRKI